MGAAGGGAPPSEQWAAPNGVLGGELRRNTNGGVPVDDTSHQYQKQASAVRESSQPNFTLKKKKPLFNRQTTVIYSTKKALASGIGQKPARNKLQKPHWFKDQLLDVTCRAEQRCLDG